MMVPLLQVVVAVHCSLLIPQEVISHSPWRPHPLHTTHLGGGGMGSPGALWGSLVNLSDLG